MPLNKETKQSFCRLINALSIFIQIISSTWNNPVLHEYSQENFYFKIFSSVKQFYFKQFSLA